MVRVYRINPEGAILAEIADRRLTRDDVALSYAFCLRQAAAGEDAVDFAAVNRAIIERWSLNALKYVKTKAWRLYGEGVAARSTVDGPPDMGGAGAA